MNTHNIKHLSLAIGLALAGTASAGSIDFTGSNIYIKFLDGDRLTEANGSIDTNSGGDQGQFSELELRMHAVISPQVEAGARVQSRSSAAYWSEFGFNGEDDPALPFTHKKFMKLRGAYVTLTPGYNWLDMATIGSSDWGMFDAFTFGKMRYIDRDNLNGLYFKGPIAGGSWEFARISLPEYLGPEFNSGSLSANDAAHIAQFKATLADTKFTAILENVSDQERLASDTTLTDGVDSVNRMRNNIFGFKAETSLMDSLDINAAFYRSNYDINNVQLANWSNLLGTNYNDNAFQINLDWSTPVDGLTVNYQHFNIGAGYVSATGARRESDVLLTEGSEAAWYGWGDPMWVGGRANDMQQVAVTIRDNDYTDFDETGAESSIGWKGDTVLLGYEVLDTPMSLEFSKIGYNTNWQDWGGRQDVFDVINWAGATGPGFKEDQDRDTTILALKVSHVFDVIGGLATSLKIKSVDDTDTRTINLATDDQKIEDLGTTLTVGNQLSDDLYGSISYGKYSRDVTIGNTAYNSDKDIYSLRFAYNLAGFEAGMLTQWISGEGDPNQDGTVDSLKQYRLKAYAKVLF